MDDDWSQSRESRSLIPIVAHLLVTSMLLMAAALMLV
jgi:hypothetical protein